MSDDLGQVATGQIYSWLVSHMQPGPREDTLTFALQEARAVAVAADDDEQAAADLKPYLRDRLTVDPGVPGPFGGLAADLLASLLDEVDWVRLVHWIRTGETED